MKKEELITLGIDEEVAKKVMAINGTDIENAKAKAGQATEKVNQELENLKSELDTTKQTLNDANSQIEKFKGMDIEGMQKAAEEWKTKYSEFETNSKAEKEAYEQKLKEQAYDFTLKEAISNLKFHNELTKNAFMNELKAKNLPLEGEKLLGFEDYIKEVGEKNPGLFVTEESKSNNEPSFQFAASTSGGQTPVKGMSLFDAMKAANEGKQVDMNQVGVLANNNY